MELLGSKTHELKEKGKEGKFLGFAKEDLYKFLEIQTDAHDAITETEQLIKLF